VKLQLVFCVKLSYVIGIPVFTCEIFLLDFPFQKKIGAATIRATQHIINASYNQRQ
jgi:hypothetical protein